MENLLILGVPILRHFRVVQNGIKFHMEPPQAFIYWSLTQDKDGHHAQLPIYGKIP